MATSTGLRVCEATSSGPAARPIPSPRFEVHDDASSHRKPVPMRGGATTSRMRPTRPRTYLAGCRAVTRDSPAADAASGPRPAD